MTLCFSTDFRFLSRVYKTSLHCFHVLFSVIFHLEGSVDVSSWFSCDRFHLQV